MLIDNCIKLGVDLSDRLELANVVEPFEKLGQVLRDLALVHLEDLVDLTVDNDVDN